jgi:hypothetical protein
MPVVYPWVKNETTSFWYNFGVSKCGKIIDLLLQAKHTRIPPNHVLLPPEELKNKK